MSHLVVRRRRESSYVVVGGGREWWVVCGRGVRDRPRRVFVVVVGGQMS